MIIIKIIVFVVVMYFISKASEWKFDGRTLSDGCRTDWSQMSNDLASGSKKSEVMQKSNMGGYDIKKNN